MLDYNTVINREINVNDLTVKEICPVIKINLRGKTREFFTGVGKCLNMILPTEPNTSSTSEQLTAIWQSPDEWMIVSNEIDYKDTNISKLNELLFNNISKTNLGAVTNVTDQFVQLEIKGKNIYDLFSSGSPFNFEEFKERKGSTTQTILNHIDVIIHNKDQNYVNLFVRRSFAKHLFDWINDYVSKL
jgi:sarcosine oxidase subunit gamma